jgi:hypothetical protein
VRLQENGFAATKSGKGYKNILRTYCDHFCGITISVLRSSIVILLTQIVILTVRSIANIILQYCPKFSILIVDVTVLVLKLKTIESSIYTNDFRCLKSHFVRSKSQFSAHLP